MSGLNTVIYSLILSGLCAGCVIENHHNNDYPLVQSQTSLLEVGCSNPQLNESLLYNEVKNDYQGLLAEDPLAFKDVISRFYTLEDPLIMNLDLFEKRYDDLKVKVAQELITKKEYAQEIYDLYNEMSRFETQKCSRDVLFLRERKDVRIATETKNLCQEYLHNNDCNEEDILLRNLTTENQLKFENAYIELCLFNKGNMINCNKKLGLIKRQNVLLKHIRAELRDFEAIKEQEFFTTNGNLKFRCQKREDQISLVINLKSATYSSNELLELGKFLSEKWSSEKFKLIVDLNENKNIVNVVGTEGRVSYVRSNDQRTIFLSNIANLTEKGNIFAHEFGHVLGFPDCYLEFYQRKTKSIVYYELEHENNLMCRVSLESKVTTDYFEQIQEKVCSFE